MHCQIHYYQKKSLLIENKYIFNIFDITVFVSITVDSKKTLRLPPWIAFITFLRHLKVSFAAKLFSQITKLIHGHEHVILGNPEILTVFWGEYDVVVHTRISGEKSILLLKKNKKPRCAAWVFMERQSVY